VFDDPAEKRGADELMNRCEYSLRGRALTKARRIYGRCLHGLYALLESHVPPELRRESRVIRLLRWFNKDAEPPRSDRASRRRGAR
jgi:hypothetical protein